MLVFKIIFQNHVYSHTVQTHSQMSTPTQYVLIFPHEDLKCSILHSTSSAVNTMGLKIGKCDSHSPPIHHSCAETHIAVLTLLPNTSPSTDVITLSHHIWSSSSESVATSFTILVGALRKVSSSIFIKAQMSSAHSGTAAGVLMAPIVFMSS